MRVVIAIDSFKGSLTSSDAGQAAKNGILKADPKAQVQVFAVADGGEGTMEALKQAKAGWMRTITVSDPLGRKIDADYIISADGSTAIIEMASAAGLPLLDLSERNPLYTTTFGVGEMILDALDLGCRKFLLGLGGSATNDGGVGMLQALGYRFADDSGKEIEHCGKGLERLATVSVENVDPRLSECKFKVAVDVANPLCGELGASAVFGPQKGADDATVRAMDDWLLNYANKTKALFDKADPTAPGVGAAGGMGFACSAYLGAKLQPGIKIVLEEIGIEAAIQSCDVVVTGEGRLDEQSVMGKTPVGVAALGQKYNKPVVAFSGCVTPGAGVCNQHGIDAYFPILGEVTSLERAMSGEVTRQNLERTAEQVFRLMERMKR